jgi:outer membrane lipoprotein-sorting protein
MNNKKLATKRHKSHKRFFGFLCAFCAFLWLILPLHAQGKITLEQVFAKMDEVSKDFRSTAADIERTHVTVLVNDKDVSSGKFYYVRKGKEPRVKLEVEKPMRQLLLIDKGKLQMYTPNLKQVQEASIGQHQDKVEIFMALGFGQSSQDLKKNFDVTLADEEVIDGKKTSVLDLKPKDTGMFKSVRMWMDQEKWVAVQIKTTEKSGDYGTLKFTNAKVNANIPDSVFDLKLPKDVKVIKM